MWKSLFRSKNILTKILGDADHAMGHEGLDAALAILRRLSLEDFGSILLEIPDAYVNLRKALPRMASTEVQRSWTGNEGKELLALSCDFIKSVERGCQNYAAMSLNNRVMLDYGCGWGRLIRLMYYHTSPAHIYGVDAWQESLDVCKQDGVLGNLALSETIPTVLPFAAINFDLVYSFSVFTHLSERVTQAALRAIRKRIQPHGLLVITLRPIEFWNEHAVFIPGYSRDRAIAEHQARGFAFVPHHRPPVDGEIPYGDTSISFDYLATIFPEWKLAGHETNASDSLQTIAFMKPV